MPDELYTPLTEAVDIDSLPVTIGGMIAPLTDRLAYRDGFFLGNASGGIIYARLHVISQAVLDLPFVPGLALVVGGGPWKCK